MPRISNDPRMAKVLAFHSVSEVIEEAIGNWTQNREAMDSTILASLSAYAERVAEKVFDTDLPSLDFATNWKRTLANKVDKAVGFNKFAEDNIPTIVSELRAVHGDTTLQFKGFWGYSLAKIAHVVGMTAHMVANDADPELLLLSREEANEQMLRLAEQISRVAPEKVVVANTSEDTVQDVVDEIRLRINPPDVSHLFKKK